MKLLKTIFIIITAIATLIGAGFVGVKQTSQEKLNQGKFAQMRKQFLKTKKKWLWNSLILKEQLNSHLNEIQQKAEQMLKSGVPETEIIQKIINN